MHFAIHCLDKAGALDTRLANYDAHRAYLAAATTVAIVISGPLLAEDGETMIGSLVVVEAADRDAVERFHRNDPFFAAGVWDRAEIHPFLKRVDNRAP
jgi:uncharacterized protein YciI